MEAKRGNGAGPDEPGLMGAGHLVYDFMRPNRLSKDQIKRIDYLHTSFAKRLSVSLAGLVRDYVEVGVSEVVETRWSELIATVPRPCVVYTYTAEPLDGSGIISVDPKLAFGFVDRLFGGRGLPVDMQRALTPIEKTIVGRLGDVVLREIEFAWSSVINLKVAVTRFASSPDLIQASGINESVIVIKLAVKTNALQGDVVIGYPYLMFEPAIRAFVKPASLEKKREPDREKVSGILNAVPLQISARMVPSMISMKLLLGLDVGDVLVLDNRVSDDLEILVEDKAILAGRPGQQGGRLAVRVIGFLEGGDE